MCTYTNPYVCIYMLHRLQINLTFLIIINVKEKKIKIKFYLPERETKEIKF